MKLKNKVYYQYEIYKFSFNILEMNFDLLIRFALIKEEITTLKVGVRKYIIKLCRLLLSFFYFCVNHSVFPHLLSSIKLVLFNAGAMNSKPFQ